MPQINSQTRPPPRVRARRLDSQRAPSCALRRGACGSIADIIIIIAIHMIPFAKYDDDDDERSKLFLFQEQRNFRSCCPYGLRVIHSVKTARTPMTEPSHKCPVQCDSDALFAERAP